MAGGFVLVAGPSGGGKDTLIGLARHALAHDARFVFPRRIVTRPSSAWEQHDTVDEAEFAANTSRYALHWRAHGLGYAIPGATVAQAQAGCLVVCNVSRGVIAAARLALPGVTAVLVTAPPALLAQRLAARDRAGDGAVAARLNRVGPEHLQPDLVIVNDATPQQAADLLIRYVSSRLT